MAQSISSWTESEENTFEYLSKQIPDSELGRNAFIGAMPPNVYEGWWFAISGPGGPGWSPECKTWQLVGEVGGRYVERAAAQELAQHVRTALVATSAEVVTSQRIRMEDGPTLARENLMIKQNEVALWVLRIPLMCTFDNTNPE